jgi:hypothetical protein
MTQFPISPLEAGLKMKNGGIGWGSGERGPKARRNGGAAIAPCDANTINAIKVTSLKFWIDII